MRAPFELQVLAVDLDGTLVSEYKNFDRPVSEANLAALRELRRTGTKVLICTGRNESSARSILDRTGDDELAASDLILQNGALVLEGGSGKLLASRHLPRDEARRYLELYRRFDLEPMMFANYSRGSLCLYEREPRNPRFALYLERRAMEGSDLLRKVDDLGDELDSDPLALGSIDEPRLIRAAHESMRNLALPESRVALQGLIDWDGGPPAMFLEVFHKDVAKEIAFEEYCRIKGHDPARCGAIGDGRNDLELVRRVGFGIAMGQAGAELHAAADYVAPPYDQSGLATALRDCLLP